MKELDLRIEGDEVSIPVQVRVVPSTMHNVEMELERVGAEIVEEMARRRYLGEEPLRKSEVVARLWRVEGVADIEIHDPDESSVLFGADANT